MDLKNVLIKDHVFDLSDNKNIKSINIQINLTHLIKDNPDIKKYYAYILTLGLVRNQIFYYKKLKKLLIPPKFINEIKIKTNKGKYENIKLEFIYYGLRNIYKLNYKQSIEIINDLLNSIYIENKQHKKIKIISVKELSKYFVDLKSPRYFYHDKDIIVPFIIKKEYKLDFKNFRNYIVHMLASIPFAKEKEEIYDKKLLKNQNLKVIKNNLSYKKIAKIVGLTSSQITNILKNNKKIYFFKKIDKSYYDYLKNIKRKDSSYIIKIPYYIFQNNKYKEKYQYFKFEGVVNYNIYKWQYYIRINGKKKIIKNNNIKIKETDRFLNTFNKKGGLHCNYMFYKPFTKKIYKKIKTTIYDKDNVILYEPLLGITEYKLKNAIEILKKFISSLNTIKLNLFLKKEFEKYNGEKKEVYKSYLKGQYEEWKLIKKLDNKKLNIKKINGIKLKLTNKKTNKWLKIAKLTTKFLSANNKKQIKELDEQKKNKFLELLRNIINSSNKNEFQQLPQSWEDKILVRTINNIIEIFKIFQNFGIKNLKFNYLTYLS